MTPVRGRRLARPLLVTAVTLLAAGCSSSGGQDPATRYSVEGATAPLPATAPYVVMTGARSGLAVWPSGGSWLLLRTVDGFRHVVNRTPLAVPTEGGLVASFVGARAAVAIGTTERLLTSPVLTSTAATTRWQPSQLPGAVADDRAAVSLSAGRLVVVTRGLHGTVLAEDPDGWHRLTDGLSLTGGAFWSVDTVTWATRTTGWLTGHGQAGVPMAFGTEDGGRTWAAVGGTSGSFVAALAPCRSGQGWWAA